MTDEVSPMEDRLKGLLFRFMEAQDKLNSERLAVATQSAKLDELIKLFSAQVQGFKELAPSVQQQLIQTMVAATKKSAEVIGDTFAKAATEQVEKTSQKLQNSINNNIELLNYHEDERKNSWYYICFAFFIGSIIAAFMVGKLAVPDPYVPLTGEQLKTYENGELFEAFWSKISDKEQKRLIAIANGKLNTDGENKSPSQDESQ